MNSFSISCIRKKLKAIKYTVAYKTNDSFITNDKANNLVSPHLKHDDDAKLDLHVLQDICQPINDLPTKTVSQPQQVVPLLITHVCTSLGIPNLKTALF